MATYDAGLATPYGGAFVRLSVWENTNEAGNSSSVGAALELFKTGGGGAWNYDASSWYVNIGGAERSGTTNYAFSSAGTKLLFWEDNIASFGHAADGSGSISVIGAFYGAGDYPIGSNNTGWQTFGFTNYVRPPTATATPTITTRGSGSTSITMATSGTATGRPDIDYYRWRIYTSGGATLQATVDTGSPYAWPNANTDTDYYITAQAHNSEGFGPISTGAWAYAAPRITAINIPSQGTVGKPYSGTVSGNNVDSYSAVSGSLPPGLSFSGGTLSGTPLTPGTYTFKVRATRNGVSYVDSATQTIQILAGGPWVKSPNGTAVFSGNITGVLGVGDTTYVYTSAPHGISEINQPITLSGFSGGLSWLNNAWLVKSWTASTLELNAPSNQPLISASGSYESQWKRSSIKVYVNGQWVQAWMRYWDAASQTWKNTA